MKKNPSHKTDERYSLKWIVIEIISVFFIILVFVILFRYC